MNADLKAALITGAVLGTAILITVPIALVIHEKGLKPMLAPKAKTA